MNVIYIIYYGSLPISLDMIYDAGMFTVVTLNYIFEFPNI